MEESATPKQVNILLVEDDEVDIMNVQRAFKKSNVSHSLHIARNGMEALQMLRAENAEKIPSPRIVLLDLNMPRMGGLELLQELRNDPQLRPTMVVIVTTSNEDRDKAAAYNLNVAGYLLKPLSSDGFVEMITTLDQYWQLCEIR